MNKLKFPKLLLFFLLLIVAGCQQGPSLEEIVLSQVDLAASADLEGMAALYADDIEFTMTGFSPEPMRLVGKQAVRGWVEEQFANNMLIEIRVTGVDGNTVTTETNFITDSLASMGLEQLTCDEVYIFEDGLLQSWSCSMNEASIQKFMQALQAMEAAAAPPKFMVTFDGEQCQVDGPESVHASRIFIGLDNQSDSLSLVGVGKLEDGLTLKEVLAAVVPGEIEPPAGVSRYSGTGSVMAGKIMDEYGVDMDPGNYILTCIKDSSGEAFPGAGLTVEE